MIILFFFIFCAAEGRFLRICISIRFFWVRCSQFLQFFALAAEGPPRSWGTVGHAFATIFFLFLFYTTVFLPRLELESSQEVNSRGDLRIFFQAGRAGGRPSSLFAEPLIRRSSQMSDARRTRFYPVRGTQRSSIGSPFSPSVWLGACKSTAAATSTSLIGCLRSWVRTQLHMQL